VGQGDARNKVLPAYCSHEFVIWVFNHLTKRPSSPDCTVRSRGYSCDAIFTYADCTSLGRRINTSSIKRGGSGCKPRYQANPWRGVEAYLQLVHATRGSVVFDLIGVSCSQTAYFDVLFRQMLVFLGLSWIPATCASVLAPVRECDAELNTFHYKMLCGTLSELQPKLKSYHWLVLKCAGRFGRARFLRRHYIAGRSLFWLFRQMLVFLLQ
jgi:hypothetical protein